MAEERKEKKGLFARLREGLAKTRDTLLGRVDNLVDGECEPRMNVMAFHTTGVGYVTLLFPRAKHRPLCYYVQGDGQRLVSPGTLDMAGLIVTPRECDFENITANEAVCILREVAMAADDVAAVADRIRNGYEKN